MMKAGQHVVLAGLLLLSFFVIGAVADVAKPQHLSTLHHAKMARRSKAMSTSEKWGKYCEDDTQGHNGNDQKSDHYLVVKTNEGRVRGLYNSTADTYSWRGVPFGDDTSGENRFMPPRPAGKWYDVRDASKKPKICPQHGSDVSKAAIALFGFSGSIFEEDAQSEDCLNANIFIGRKNWEKYRDSNGKAKKLPVWLNLYGGSFEWGSNTVETYQSHKLVHDNDIITVSINFRNWILGFPQAPQLHTSKNQHNAHFKGSNPGLSDVDLAIEWVYNNIEKFGGDPEKITIGGTSTGACIADNWAYVHYQKPTSKYVKGIILQSGSMTSLGKYFVTKPEDDFTEKKSVWNKVAAYLGCGTNGDDKQMNCMQKKKWQDVIQATFATNTSFMLTSDNITAYNDYSERLVQRKFANTPMLIGNCKDEGNAWLIHDAQLTAAVGPLITAEVWVCPSNVQAKHRMGYASTWRYRFSPSFYLPDTPEKYQSLLTYHGSDTAYSWETWQDLRYIPTKQAEEDKGPLLKAPRATDDDKIRAPVAHMYSAAFVEFVKDPDNGLYDFESGWPVYSPQSLSIGDFGYKNSPQFRLASPHDVDGLCPFTDAEIKENNEKWRETAQRMRPFMF